MKSGLFQKLRVIPTILLGISTSLLALAAPQHLHEIPLHQTSLAGQMMLDTLSRRVFLPEGNQIAVLYADTLTSAGYVGLPGGGGMVLAPDLQRGFVSTSQALLPFSLQTLQLEGKPIPLDDGSAAVVYDPATRYILTFSLQDSQVVAVDAVTETKKATIPLGGRCIDAAPEGTGRVFAAVNSMDSVSGSIVLLGASPLAIQQCWLLPDGLLPARLALDKVHHRLFAVCYGGKLAVLDTDTGHVISTIHAGIPLGTCLFDPAKRQLIAISGNGTLAVIQEQSSDTYQVLSPIKTPASVVSLAWDTIAHHLLVVTAEKAPPPLHSKSRNRYPVFRSGTYALQVYGDSESTGKSAAL